MKSIIRTGKTVNDAVNQALEVLNTTREKVSIEILEEPKSGILGILGRKDAIVKVTLEEEDLVAEIIADEFGNKEDIQKSLASEKKELDFSEVEKSDPRVVEDEKIESSRGEEPTDNSKIEAIAEKNNDYSVIENLMKSILKGMEIEAGLKINETPDFIKVVIDGASEKDTGVLIGRRGETLDAIQYLLSLAVNKNHDDYKRILLDINDYRAKREESLIKLANKMAYKVKKAGRSMRLEPMNPYERRIIHSALQKVDGVETISEGKEPFRRVVIKLER